MVLLIISNESKGRISIVSDETLDASMKRLKEDYGDEWKPVYAFYGDLYPINVMAAAYNKAMQ